MRGLLLAQGRRNKYRNLISSRELAVDPPSREAKGLLGIVFRMNDRIARIARIPHSPSRFTKGHGRSFLPRTLRTFRTIFLSSRFNIFSGNVILAIVRYNLRKYH